MGESKIILGIESSCDETSAALFTTDGKLLADYTAGQEEVHQRWGGIVPELASRKHLEFVLPVIQKCLKQSKLSYRDIDAIAVTNRPGLIGSLMIGVSCAKTLAYSLEIPLISIDHLEAHLSAVTIENDPQITFPALGLIVSGGHTSLYEIEDNWQEFKALGHTRDDAAGEAFDKGARLLGLGYPGGPEISKLAKDGRMDAIDFPRALPSHNTLDFSFSGLKTSLVNFLRLEKNFSKPDIAASYQEAIVDALVIKTKQAVKQGNYKDLIVAGGVAANERLRFKMQQAMEPLVRLHIPPVKYCTDNGAMIASLGAIHFKRGVEYNKFAVFDVTARPRTSARANRGPNRIHKKVNVSKS